MYETLARLPSLVAVRSGTSRCCFVREEADLSPLFTADLQPTLPQLRTFHFPRMRVLLTRPDAAVLAHSSVAFLTAYSSQLRELELQVYARESTGRLLEAVLHCSQLTILSIACDTTDRVNREADCLDVRQLDPAVASLSPLPLTSWR